jgi:hypothetical protein
MNRGGKDTLIVPRILRGGRHEALNVLWSNPDGAWVSLLLILVLLVVGVTARVNYLISGRR